MNLTANRHVELGATPEAAWGVDDWPADISDRKRRANEFMRDGLEHQDPAEPIPFFCECEAEQCFLPVWLTRPEYDSVRRHERARLAAADHDDADRPIARAAVVG